MKNQMVYRHASERLEWAEAAFLDHRFSPHRHDSYAVGFTTYGTQVFGYRGETWASAPGDVFALYPDELHDGRPGTGEGFGYKILYVSPRAFQQASGRSTLPFLPRPVATDQWLKEVMRHVFDRRYTAWGGFLETETLCAVADALERAACNSPKDSHIHFDEKVFRVREHLMACCTENVTMAELEHQHGLDRFTIARHFRRAFGVSPHRFLILRRLDIAKQSIRQGNTLAEAAAEAGFSDQSHLTRLFRAAFGLPPGQWRALTNAPGTV